MLKLPNKRLPSSARDGLRLLQQGIDTLPTYEDRVTAAKSEFSKKNTAKNAIFSEVRRVLAEMSGGQRRCGYCEDSLGDEVEHIRPKDLYPEAVFTWRNYLYACGPCNGPKNNGFAIVEQVGGQMVATSVARRRADPVVPPRAGPPALIDPRREDPLALLVLDLTDTFFFTPVGADGTASRARAAYTTSLLALNSRDYLVRTRRAAYMAYLGILTRYVARKEAGATAASLRLIKAALLDQPHPTVWAEMKRQQANVPELSDLFQKAPEALRW